MLLTTKVPVVPVDATAAERSVHVVPLVDPCNLKVLVAAEDKAHEFKSNETPDILVVPAGVNLNKSTPTQLIAPLKADIVLTMLSIELVIA